MLSKPSKYYMFPVLAIKDYLLLVLLAWFIVFKGFEACYALIRQTQLKFCLCDMPILELLLFKLICSFKKLRKHTLNF